MKDFILRVPILVLIISLMTSCGSNLTTDYAYKNHHYERMVASGWILAKRWDFYNALEEWKHELATKEGKGGIVKIEDGIFEFGYSSDGGIIYYPSKIRRIPKTSYLIIARVKTDNPLRAIIGFYTPSKLLGATRIRKSKWHIVRSLFSIDPVLLGEEMPPNISPAIKHLSRDDYSYIDWVELWVHQQQTNDKDYEENNNGNDNNL